jgi:hypothetical protein
MKRSVETTRAISVMLIEQAEACTAAAAALCGDAADLRARARAIRSRHETGPARRSPPLRSFFLEGVVEHRAVHAEWRDGGLVADPLLLERAELLVSLGEQFGAPNTGPYTASLCGLPIVALLTLMRACDRVQTVDVVAGPGRSGSSLAQRVSWPRPEGGPGSG